MSEFILKQGSMQHKFLQSVAKLQIVGGGFGNGKTTAAVQKAIRLSQMYPGSNGLIARATLPKLNDTIRKEFLKWCPKSLIASFPMPTDKSSTCTFKNGSTINFRYIAQRSNGGEDKTSNLLSATYDWVLIDQIEDPEIVHKDFLDILGRMRGSARASFDPDVIDPVLGDLSRYPRTGPRWVMLTTNPTANWVYKQLVRPLHLYQKTGVITPELQCVRDNKGEPILGPDDKVMLLIELFEGSTYENLHVYEHMEATDFIQTLESSYKGQMRDRFLMGEWASYEGLIYPQFNDITHQIPQTQLLEILQNLLEAGIAVPWREGYDFGIASPSCYLLSFTDHLGNVYVCDGFYQKEMPIDEQAAKIHEIRAKWVTAGTRLPPIYADPSVLKRAGGGGRVVGQTVADMFRERKVSMQAGNNDILNGIIKIQGYLDAYPAHRHPVTQTAPAPYLYVATELSFLSDEFSAYMWATSNAGDRVDNPAPKQADHALDALKYLMSTKPEIAKLRENEKPKIPAWMSWHEHDTVENKRKHRYG